MPVLNIWLGDHVPLAKIVWRYMLIVGSSANLAFLAGALLMAAHDFPDWAAFLVFLVPFPYNCIVWNAVWRRARTLRPIECVALRAAASFWLAMMVIL